MVFNRTNKVSLQKFEMPGGKIEGLQGSLYSQITQLSAFDI